MVINSADIGSMNQDTLKGEMSRIIELDNQPKIEGHPKEAEYVRISEQAKATIGRMTLALSMPTGFPILEQAAEQLKELYEQAVIIRAEIAHENIRKSFGVSPGQDLETTLEAEVEKATEVLGSGLAKPITDDLMNLARAFDVNPADTMEGSVDGNKFFMAFNHKTGVNFEQVDKARARIDRLRQAARTHPELAALAALADKFEAGLQSVEASDPARLAHHKWYQETFAGKRTNWRPAMTLLRLLAAPIFAVGLAQTAMSKDHTVSPATVLWGGILILPGMAWDNATRVIDGMYALGSKHIHELVALGFKGVDGKAAFEELQDICKTKPSLLKSLQKSDKPLTMSQIGMLTDGKETALTKVMAKIPEDKRAAALQTFGRAMNDADAEYVGGMIAVRGGVDPSVTPLA